MNCIHCSKDFKPAFWEWLPSPFWGVSFTCPMCDRENRVHWPVTAGLMLLCTSEAIGLMFGATRIAGVSGVNGRVVATVAIGFLVVTFVLLLRAYLRVSKAPFVTK